MLKTPLGKLVIGLFILLWTGGVIITIWANDKQVMIYGPPLIRGGAEGTVWILYDQTLHQLTTDEVKIGQLQLVDLGINEDIADFAQLPNREFVLADLQLKEIRRYSEVWKLIKTISLPEMHSIEGHRS